MATYKVIQDVEAEDKLIGPLSLRQFIYAGIAALCLYLSFLSLTKHAGFLAIFFMPVAGFTGFFAFPWGKDQPTEVWALAKIRFFLKPRKRIWDQSGVKELVTITAPKRVERNYSDGLSPTEVRSRLSALADTIDSRGWAIKNVNVNMYDQHGQPNLQSSDRLVNASSLPQEVSGLDITASDDILDEQANPVAHQFDAMINASSQARRQQLMTQLQQPTTEATPASQTSVAAPNDYWFLNQAAPAPVGSSTFVDAPVVAPGTQDEPAGAPTADAPTAEEEALVAYLKAENASQHAAYGHMKTVAPLSEQAAAQNAALAQAKTVAPKMTPKDSAAIMNLANNDDLNVATIARQAKRQKGEDDGEVVISLR
ncbi:MAG: PrgI family protein [Candidatus Saccharimonadales bacterium]